MRAHCRGRIEPIDRAAVYARDKGLCWLCGQAVERIYLWHLVPLAAGGDHTAENVVLAHPRCVLLNARRSSAIRPRHVLAQ